jgi:hypothetical protein
MLAASPNVIVHLAGHHHQNRVRAICPDGSVLDSSEGRCDAGPGRGAGYWEIATAAVVDFPHQGRFVEVIHVEGRLAALYLTMLDPQIPADSFTERGRFIARAWEAFHRDGDGGLGQRTDRNVLLPVVLPEAVATRWDTSSMATAIESETTLTEPQPPLPRLPVWPGG